MKKHTCTTPRLNATLPSRKLRTLPATNGRCAGKQSQKARRTVRRQAALKDSTGIRSESPTIVARAVAADRRQDLWEQPIEYLYHKSFDKPGMEAEILGPAPEAPAQRLTKAPSGLPAYLASLYEVPLLTREQEAHYFRKLNYLKYQAARLRQRLDASRAGRLQIARLEDLLRQAGETKNLLIRANLRLVVSVVRNHVRSDVDFSELISDGNMSLMRAIDRFDFSRGFKFSTYAVWAIRNNFSRSISNEHVHRERFRTGSDGVFHEWSDRRSDPFKEELAHEQRRETVRRILRCLSDREQNILASRFGLQQGSEPLTLEEVGAQQGVTKERIRQLEKRAINKLREMAIVDDAA
ncbi:MAG: sigma-70 family RNA polymerase sigma factor [Deltaproteobacteria bacterium]